MDDKKVTNFKYIGDFSATPPWASRYMQCYDCEVSWTGCWDNFQCPICESGDLPSYESTLMDGLDKNLK